MVSNSHGEMWVTGEHDMRRIFTLAFHVVANIANYAFKMFQELSADPPRAALTFDGHMFDS